MYSLLSPTLGGGALVVERKLRPQPQVAASVLVVWPLTGEIQGGAILEGFQGAALGCVEFQMPAVFCFVLFL